MLINDFRTVLNYKNKKGNKTIEDVNEILLSNDYYPVYKEYGVDNFLAHYAQEVKTILLQKKLERDLAEKKNFKSPKI